MRLLVTNTYYFPAFDGGAEISVKLLAEGLAADGHRVYVLTTGRATKVYRVNGVIVISVKQKNIFNSYNKGNISLLLKMIWHTIDSCNPFYHFQISNILKRIKPDLIHTNNIQGFSPFLWLTIKSRQIPLVHSMRDYYMLCFKCNMFSDGQNCDKLCNACKFTHAIKRNFFKYPDYFVGISDFILKKYESYLKISKERSSIIYNAVAARPLTRLKPLKEKIHFGYIGRIAKDKGVEYLVDELAKLSDDLKQTFRIVFAGNGDDNFIDELKIKLTGIDYAFLGLSKPEEFYPSIDILLVPALWNEPFGRIVIESLSYGVPVCQSDRGGLKELYNPETSWLFSPEKGNLVQLAEKILIDRDTIVSKKLKCAYATVDYSAERYVGDHVELYHQLIGEKYSKAGAAPALLIETD